MTAQEELVKMIRNKEDSDFDTLMKLYEQLEPTTIEFMIGQWHGGNFDSKVDIGPFYGKRFNSAEDCEPMLFKKEDGTIYAWKDWGDAQLREVRFGDKVQATVIYDDRPLMDYFRKVTDDIVIGLGDLKRKGGKPASKGFFWLERDR